MTEELYNALEEIVLLVKDKLKDVDHSLYKGKKCLPAVYYTLKLLDKLNFEGRAHRLQLPVTKEENLVYGGNHYVVVISGYRIDAVFDQYQKSDKFVWRPDEKYPLKVISHKDVTDWIYMQFEGKS